MEQLGFFAATGTDNLLVAVNPTIISEETANSLNAAIDAIADAVAHGPVKESQLVAIANAFDISDIQECYNALEAAIVRLAERDSTFDNLERLMANVPAQRRRTAEKDDLQQFSTPLTIGRYAAVLGSPSPFDRILEPSAGTGILVAGLRDHDLLLNEIDKSRRAILSELFPAARISRHDARYIDALYPKANPTLVLMNPPFSHDIRGAADSAKVGIDHVHAALRLLIPNGRLVAILGSNQHPTLRPEFWTNVLKDGSLRLAVNVDGADYYKMGTTFGNCVVVIDKAPGLETVLSDATSRRIRDLYDTRPALPRIPLLSIAASEEGALTRKATRVRNTGRDVWKPIFGDATAVNYAYQQPTALQDEEGRFLPYNPSIACDAVAPHPDSLVESAALASVSLPAISTPITLTKNALAKLSIAQLETVLYAQRAFESTITLLAESANEEVDENQEPGEYRHGMMIGSGTGVGKGRIIAAIILAEMLKGNTKAIWVSENQNLFEDASRDWNDIAGAEHAGALMNLSDFNVRDRIVQEHGILFCTFATLRNEAKQTARSRVDQILEWVGEDEVYLNFDECHNLANALTTKAERGVKKGSKQGAAALTLQNKLPQARVTYTSATAASMIEAFSYAPRLGLWSSDSAFTSRTHFLETLAEGGTGALEVICRDLKAQGYYIAQSLSLVDVRCDRLEHDLTDDQIEQYNALARAWRIIDRNLREIIDGTDSRLAAAALSAIASARQRSLQSFLVSAQLPTVLAHADEVIKNGGSPVFQLTNTYEAAQSRALGGLEKIEDLEDLDLSAKQIVIDYLNTAFPTAKLVEQEDAGGAVRLVPLTDEDNNPVLDPDLVEERDDLVKQLNAFISPEPPITILLDHFGSNVMAEVTGRKQRVLRELIDGRFIRRIDERPGDANSMETTAFMNGDKIALVFSEGAGGTGRSYHASRVVKNQRPRVHYLLQTGWRSDRAIQGLGRTHRTNQASAPAWILCTTNAPGQRRFISTIARRIEQLGAATRGQRDAAGNGMFSGADNLETIYGQLAVTSMVHSIVAAQGPISYALWLEQIGLHLTTEEDKVKPLSVPRFLNCVLACDLQSDGAGPQQILMNDLVERIETNVRIARERGEYDEGVINLHALSVHASDTETLNITEDGAKTDLVTLTLTIPTNRLSFAQILSRVRHSRERYKAHEAFFAIDDQGEIVAAYRIADVSTGGKPVTAYNIARPGHTTSLLDQYPYVGKRVDDDTAHELWNDSFKQLDETTTKTQFLVAGALLPVYHHLPARMARIVRVRTSDGLRLIGRLIETSDAQALRVSLGSKKTLSMDEILRAVVDENRVALFGNWQLRRIKLAGQWRVEIIVPPFEAPTLVRLAEATPGIVAERIDYKQRYFLDSPRNDCAASRFIGDRPLRSVA